MTGVLQVGFEHKRLHFLDTSLAVVSPRFPSTSPLGCPPPLSLPLDSDSLQGSVSGAREREEAPHEITRHGTTHWLARRRTAAGHSTD